MTTPRILAQGKFLRLLVDGTWEYAERTHTQMPVGIIALTDDGKLLLIEQYRIPVHSTVIEIPAGLVGDHDGQTEEPFEEAAKRELLEETGYSAATIEQIAIGPSTPGMVSEMSRLVRATGLRKIGPPQPDAGEQITLLEIPIAEVSSYLKTRNAAGTPVDWKVYAACWFLNIPS